MLFRLRLSICCCSREQEKQMLSRKRNSENRTVAARNVYREMPVVESTRWIEFKKINVWVWVLFHVPIAVVGAVVAAVCIMTIFRFHPSAVGGAFFLSVLSFFGVLVSACIQALLFNLVAWIMKTGPVFAVSEWQPPARPVPPLRPVDDGRDFKDLKIIPPEDSDLLDDPEAFRRADNAVRAPKAEGLESRDTI